MIPSVVANQVRSCISDYLRSAYRPTNAGFEGLIERFLEISDNYCKGPYISVGLPFRPGQVGADFFKEIPLNFHPHRHQEQAFQRLKPPSYQSTLIATGTGSGKTECFLLPILEHCRQERSHQGIKAILIYPMNALATDQAKRIAKLIYNTPSLQGKVTAGLYIGDIDEEATSTMGPEKIITDRGSILQSPPDILLTNYKMLDYLLIQPKSQQLWRHNHSDTLRYIVVDEFHTFDGAQGTDLACLLRRLKFRLNTPPGHIACVGTSATLGGKDNIENMLKYAETIFAETFDEGALIVEDRLNANEFLYDQSDNLLNVLQIPTLKDIDKLRPESYHEPTQYLQAQSKLWLQDFSPAISSRYSLELGRELKTLPIVQNLLRTLNDGPKTYTQMMETVGRRLGISVNASEEYLQLLLDSLLSLMASARSKIQNSQEEEIYLPWVSLKVQYWFRELRRMVASVTPLPELLYSDDLNSITPDDEDKTIKTLPVLHCQECGATGWAGLRTSQDAKKIEAENLRNFYQAFFSENPLLTIAFPNLLNSNELIEQKLLCGKCLSVNLSGSSKCNSCAHEPLIPVHIPDLHQTKTKNGQKQLVASHDCPYCNSNNGLTILGAASASLSSAAIGVLYATPFNADKKLLAFSDSVQDAAHRAGFYAARTYRTTLLTAITKTIANFPAGVNLAELVEIFPLYWEEQLKSTANFVATFLPSDLDYLNEWVEFINSDLSELPKGTMLPKILKDRLTWEIVNQFGFRSKLGASLERSAVCSTYFATAALEKAVKDLHFKLSNEIEALRNTPLKMFGQFILGLLHHLRGRGGIHQPATKSYINYGGNIFLWKKFIYMPSMGLSSPRPLFYVNSTARAEGFEEVTRPDRRNSWSEDWTMRLFGSANLLFQEQLTDILHVSLQTLVDNELLEVLDCNKGKAWGIPMNAIYLQTQGTRLACTSCSHQITSSPQEHSFLLGMPCLSIGCQGNYGLDKRTGLTYYKEIYSRGEVQRIVAAEHTGLLSRSNRENLEKRFITSLRRCDPNLISATATLEMGINIGDLSTVLLSSVPPSPANFQQRIGRAGRRDGNALVGVIANGRPHDLFFYAEPMEMLTGNVEPAGCYLDASAILQRQLTAFCLDNWIATGVSGSDFPRLLSDALNTIEKGDQKRFPYNWLAYIGQRQGELLENFLKLFEKYTLEHTRDELRTFMEKGEQDEGGLRWRIIDRLESLRKERNRLSNQIKNISEKLKKLKKEPEALQNSERIEELEQERSAFKELMKELNQKQILNFLTDDGLLPNYAFPESGVTLRSILWRKVDKSEQTKGKTYRTQSISYERPSKLAIRELVPSGVFYAEGRRVKIDQIDLKLSEPENWRICPSCNYTVRAIEPEASNKSCPRCNDNMWSDHGQLLRMLRLRQVMATTSDRDSRFGDDRDERNPSFFQRHLLVDFSQDYLEKTFSVKEKDFPFGFEYISKTNFREINLGETNLTGEPLKIAGYRYHSKGFSVCSSCGKIIKGEDSTKNHTINCQWRDKSDQAKALEVLYLYREFESESIRFLLPDDNFWTTEGQNSFIAALQLGLKLKFSGQVEHLQTTISQEPQPNSILSKSFLYLFDSVPGGTGYLRQLIRNPEDMKDVFNQALKIVRSCECQEKGKDGCYRCLYAYRNSFDRGKTSRKKAQNLLSTIVKYWPHLEESGAGLSAIRLNSNFESELERNFIEAIRRFSPTSEQRPNLRKDIFNGKAGYYLKMGEKAWKIETQVFLGKNEGVSIPSRVDFLISPANDHSKGKPIAIFTDGWEYHKERINEDFQQRLAILRSNRYWCWSLTWDDVERERERESDKSKISTISLNGLSCQLNSSFQEHRSQIYQKYDCASLDKLESKSSFIWLMNYLGDPKHSQWQRWGQMRTLAQSDQRSLQDENIRQQWIKEVEAILEQPALEVWQETDKFLCGKIEIAQGLTLWSAINLHANQDPNSSFVLIHLDEIPTPDQTNSLKANWNEALRLLNLYQFLPHIYALTTTGQEQWISPPVNISSHLSNQEEDQWTAVANIVLLDELQESLVKMSKENWPLPEAGYELINEGDTVIAEAELAWIESKAAIVSEPADQLIFNEHGWFAVTVQEFLKNINTIKKYIEEY